MKKKLVAGLLTTVMASTMICGTAFAAEEPAWNTQGGKSTVEGINTVVEPTIEVELPGSLEFAIDPLYLSEVEGTDGKMEATTTQIVSSDYTIINYSNVAVNVKAETSVSATGTDVELSNMAATTVYDANTNELKPVSGKKAIALAMLLPTSAATVDSDEGTAELNTTALLRDATQVASAVKGFVLDDTKTESAPATVNYLLNKYDETAGLAAGNVSGFRFDGFVDTTATFEADDVTVKTVFTLKALTENGKNAFTPGQLGDSNKGYDNTVAEAK